MDLSDNSRSSSGARDGRSGSGKWEGTARPVSRRGILEYSANRSGAMRAGSEYRGGTASRLGSSGFGALPPTASRLPTAMSGFAVTDRPLTRGLSGLRTGAAGTARGFRSRTQQDRRYWEEMLQHRMREMKAEMGRLQARAEAAERDHSANKHYEKRVRELALELTDLQGRLSDYNTAIRISSGEVSLDEVEAQSRELEASNARAQAAVEQVLLEKQRKEMQLNQIVEQLEKEQSSIAHILSELTPAERAEYEELEAAAAALREDTQRASSELETLQAEKQQLDRDIGASQMKVHLVELHRRLASAERRRDEMSRDTARQPHEERETLLAQVREDNATIASMESNAASLKEQIRKVQELIEQAEQDLEEGNSERHQKYRELKKREETMESFLSTYEETMKKEQEKIDKLENDIVFALEHTSSNIDLDLGEIDALKQKEGYGGETQSVEGLTKEYERLRANLKKAESTRERLGAELQTLPEKCSAMEQELVVLSDLERLREEGAEQKKALETEVGVVRDKLAPTESAVMEAASKLTILQTNLEENEMYTKLVALEEKVAQLESRRAILEEDISSISTQHDYEGIKREALQQVAVLNKQIMQDLITSAKAY